MTVDGKMDWQNALTEENLAYLVSEDGDPVADAMFLNFWWTSDIQHIPIQPVIPAEIVILDIFQNQFPIALSLPHPVPSGPAAPCGGLGA